MHESSKVQYFGILLTVNSWHSALFFVTALARRDCKMPTSSFIWKAIRTKDNVEVLVGGEGSHVGSPVGCAEEAESTLDLTAHRKHSPQTEYRALP